MMVAENMGFSLKFAKVSKAEIQRRVHEVTKILDLEGYLERYPRQLSGGQRQRVAMGRAIVRQPKVYLFDGLLSNLDAKLRIHMRAKLKALHARLKTTTIYVTHDQVEAMTMADRIVVMRAGIVEQIGDPLEVYDEPANTFVASFIGSPAMNLLEGVSVPASRSVTFPNGSKLVHRNANAPDGTVILGIRSEHLAPVAAAEAADQEGLHVQIAAKEPTGSDTLLSVIFGEQELTVQVRHRVTEQAGDSMRLLAPPEAIHLFDMKTQTRIAG